MSGTSKSRSKGAIKSKSHLDQHEISKECEKNEEKSSDDSVDIKSTEIIENGHSATATEKKYKMPYRNFLRDLKIQMQNEHLSNKELIKIASERWRRMSLEEKTPYIREAAVFKQTMSKSLKKRAQAAARQETIKRKRRCPKCGGYTSSSSPSSTSEPSTNVTTESTSGDYYHDCSSETESTYYSHHTSDYDSDMSDSYSSQQSSSSNRYDAVKKKTARQKNKRRRNSRRVKKRKVTSTSGSASHYTNSSDGTFTSDTADCSGVYETHGTSNDTSGST